MSAVAEAKDIFLQRGIGIDQLPPAKDELMPLNEEAEAQRATQVNNTFGIISPGLSRTLPTCSFAICGSGRHCTS